MLTTAAKALHYYEKFLEFGCLICIFPYKWGKGDKRLYPAGGRVLVIFHWYLTLILCATSFFAVRFFMARKNGVGHDQVPLFAKVSNSIWLLSCMSSSVCIYQVKTCRHDIMAFHNTLLSHWRKSLDNADEEDVRHSDSEEERDHVSEETQDSENNPGGGVDVEHAMSKSEEEPVTMETHDSGNSPDQEDAKSEFDLDQIVEVEGQGLDTTKKDRLRSPHISAHAVLQILNFLSVIPSHSLRIFLSPCSPNFISSLILPCGTEGSMVWFPLVIPFFLYESLVVVANMMICMLCWFGIFLGLAWIYCELMDVSMNPWDSSMVPQVIQTYKKLHLLITQMNCSFHLCLVYFSSMVFALMGFAIYGSIHLVGNDWRSLICVSCIVMCGLECVTPLIMAGNVNNKSTELLGKMRQTADPRDKEVRMELKSLGPLQIRAGSFHTYENNIVLMCLQNLVELMLNSFNLF